MTNKKTQIKNNTFRIMDAEAEVWYYITYNANKANYAIDELGNLVGPVENDERLLIILHREDGPALITSRPFFGHRRAWWCLNGFTFTFDEWSKKVDLDEEKMTWLKLKYA